MSDTPSDSNTTLSPKTIEEIVGQSVDDIELYQRALTHRSLLRARPDDPLRSNERLEFLGDAFLDLVVSEILYAHFPEKDEGALTRIRARIVSRGPLAQFARMLDLGPHLRISRNAERDSARTNPGILGDAFEALVGAVYLDLGHEAARTFVTNRVLVQFDLSELAARDENYKSQLLERMQAVGRPQPTYPVVKEEGPSHDKTFTVEVKVGDTRYACGTASTKQDAEQEAAQRTLRHLDERDPSE